MRIMINDGVRKTIGKCNECVFYNEDGDECKNPLFEKPMLITNENVIHTNCPLIKIPEKKQISIDGIQIKVEKCTDCPVCATHSEYGSFECRCQHPKRLSEYLDVRFAEDVVGVDCPLEDYKKATKKVN